MLKTVVVPSMLATLIFVLLFSGCGIKAPPQPPEPERKAMLVDGNKPFG